MTTKINGCEPGEQWNLNGADKLSPSVRSALRNIPTRAEMKERQMGAVDSLRGIAKSLEMSAAQMQKYAASNCEDCEAVHMQIELAGASDRLVALKLCEIETGVAASLHPLYHHLHQFPLEIANQLTEEALQNYARMEEARIQVLKELEAEERARKIHDIFKDILEKGL